MPRTGLTAQRLTVAAADLADEVGFDKVTVSALARRFGVKDASLYAHIRSAQDLRERVAVLAMGELADQAGAALAGRAGKDALVAFAGTYRAYATGHPGRYAAMQVQLELDPSDEALRVGRRHTELTAAILRGYRLPEPDQTDAVRFLHSTFHGFVSLELAGGFRHTPRSTDLSWARALDALDVALTHWPSGSAGDHGAD